MFQITHLLHVAKLGKNVLPILLTLYTYKLYYTAQYVNVIRFKKKQTQDRIRLH